MQAAEAKPPQLAEAGHSGADIRSDCRTAVEPRASGGLAIELTSRVKPYYGRAIEQQARDVLAQLGVQHARVIIEDEGALPWCIAARLEAAAKRAGLAQGRRALPEALPLPPPSPRDHLRRSRLYLPGSEPKYFINAGLHEPDAVILDLEDAVHPREKDAARILVRNALRAVDFMKAERMVRINQLPLGLEDLEEVVPESPDVIPIPKVETAGQVVEVDDKIREIQGLHKLTRPIWLLPILESALGVENAFAVARASERICALTIGLEDYTSDLGVVKTAEGAESLYARQRLVNAARAAGVQANDSVFGDVGDMEALRGYALASRAMGFEGMGCVHPLQVEVIHQAFAPTPQEIEKALRIVAAFEEAQQRGLAVVSLGSKMIDPPVVQRALKLVQRARAMGLVKEQA